MPFDSTPTTPVTETQSRRLELARALRAHEFDFQWNFRYPWTCGLEVARRKWGCSNVNPWTGPDFFGITEYQFETAFYLAARRGGDRTPEGLASYLESLSDTTEVRPRQRC